MTQQRGAPVPSGPMAPQDPSQAFAADLDAAAAAGLSLETFEHLLSQHFEPGQLADFLELDQEMKSFVLRVLGGLAGNADYEWFNSRDDAKSVAAWMLTLPGIRSEG